jgi:uncharacterized protein YkwD
VGSVDVKTLLVALVAAIGLAAVLGLSVAAFLACWVFAPAEPTTATPPVELSERPKKLPTETKRVPPEKGHPQQSPQKNDDKSPPEKKQETPLAAPEDPKRIQGLMETLLRQVNTYRKMAGLDMVELDAELARGCAAHANYLHLNMPERPEGLVDEEVGKAGFSEEGRQAARVAMVSIGNPHQAMEQWMGRLGGRVRLLQPELRTIGVGLQTVPSGAWVVVLDLARGSGDPIVLYPLPGQTDVPLTFAGGPEVPDANAIAGFPVTATFPPLRKVTQVKTELLDEAGKAVDGWLSMPEKPSHEKGARNTISLIAKAPLRANSAYRVQMTASLDGQAWSKSWTFTTEDDADSKGLWAKKALDKVNGFRKLAGLAPVVLDTELSRGCQAHARYLALNDGHPATVGLKAHHEDMTLPGASEAGDKAGAASDISIGEPSPLLSVDTWMATLYHRVPILEPNLKSVGFGCTRVRRQRWVVVLNVHTGRDNRLPRPQPVFYPAADQTGVPLHFPIFGEEPNPIPEDSTGRAGYPVTAFFPHDTPLKSASAIFTDNAGKEVPLWFSSLETPANPKFAKNQGNTVCMIPKEPLRPNTTYRILLRGQRNGTGWQNAWQFTTGNGGLTPTQAAAQSHERLNVYRKTAGLPAVTLDAALSKGCQDHAQYLVRNAALLAKKKLLTNDEDPDLPGYTAEGKRAARQSHVFSRTPEPITQVDDIMSTVQWRSYLLDPQLRRLGAGCAQDVGRGWQCVLDPFGGRGGDRIVLYPVQDQDGVPCAGFDRLNGQKDAIGFPISATFPAQVKVMGGKGTLTDADGQTVETLLATPEQPLDGMPPPRNTVCLYPRAPLRPGRSYTVTLSAVVNGQQWRQTWQFTTE